MWARTIDGTILVSEDFAEQIKALCIPGARILANGENITLGKSMDLERTGDDDRFWFYSGDERYALQIDMLRSEDSFEITLVERKMYWFGALKEKTVGLTSLSFPETNVVVIEEQDPETKKL